MGWPLIMAIGSVTVAAIGIVVGKGTASAQKNVATIERTGPDWDAFMERIERHHENSIGNSTAGLTGCSLRCSAWKISLLRKISLSRKRMSC